ARDVQSTSCPPVATDSRLSSVVVRQDAGPVRSIRGRGDGTRREPAMSRSIFSAAMIAVAVLTPTIAQNQPQSSSEAQSIFRFDTFGDEQLWTDTLQMDRALRNVTP